MRYFMHVTNGHGFVQDEEGCELPDEAAARRAALVAARDVMAGDMREGFLDLTSFITVEDEAHTFLFRLVFADAVRIRQAVSTEC